MELMDRMTPTARELCVLAGQEAVSARAAEVGCEYLLVALFRVDLREDIALQALLSGLDLDEVRRRARALTENMAVSRVHPLPYSQAVNGLFSDAAGMDISGGRITPRTLLVCLMRDERPSTERGKARQLLSDLMAEQGRQQDLAAAVSISRQVNRLLRSPLTGIQSLHRFNAAPVSVTNFTVDLTARAREGRLPAVSGRERETDELLSTLLRSRKNTPVLVGPAGVGKTAIVEGLAARIAAGEVPESFKNRSILSLDLAGLVSGTRYRGDFEERMTSLLDKLRSEAHNTILFVDELHAIMGVGSSSDSRLDAATMLKPALARGEVQLIGATTASEYEQLVADAAFERRLHPIWVAEPSLEQARGMLVSAAADLAAHHQLHIDAQVAEQAVTLSDLHLPHRRLPDKAIDLLDAACAGAVLAGRRQVSDHDLREVLGSWLGRPVQADQDQRLRALRQRMNARVLGQQPSIERLCGRLERSMLGLSERRGPLGAFLLAGPPGVGKTETARALAEELMGSAEALVRLDMSEYTERHDLSKLLGAAPGYIGYEHGSALTEQLRHSPHRVLLFDEVEKAHPDVLGVLLQALEEGEITDSHGQRADLRHCVVLLTSNLGSGQRRRSPGFASQDSGDEQVLEAVRAQLRPELLDRLDGICLYQPLDDQALDQLADRALQPLQRQLAERSIELTVTSAARRLLRECGRQASGVRALRRAIDEQVADPVAQLLLSGQPPQHITLRASGEEIHLSTS